MNCDHILNCTLLANIIRGIPYTGTVSEFQSLCGITSHTACVELLHDLNSNGIGRLNKGEVNFSSKDKINLVHSAIQQNCNPRLLSQNLSWKDFESFVSIILQKIGYRCATNVHLTKPHMQIDVVATMGTKALIIDCKHWRNMGASEMEECATRQHMRTKSYLKTHNGIDYAIPIILTLNEPARNFINKIPFVSISKLGSFLCNYDVCTNQLLHVLA